MLENANRALVCPGSDERTISWGVSGLVDFCLMGKLKECFQFRRLQIFGVFVQIPQGGKGDLCDIQML